MSEKDGEGNIAHTQDAGTRKYGVGYNFGQIAAGLTKTSEDETNGTETTMYEYGVTYAASDKLSVGLLRTTLENTAAAKAGKETITGVQAGYSLGPVGLEVYHVTIEEAGAVATVKDQEKVGLRLTTKF